MKRTLFIIWAAIFFAVMLSGCISVKLPETRIETAPLKHDSNTVWKTDSIIAALSTERPEAPKLTEDKEEAQAPTFIPVEYENDEVVKLLTREKNYHKAKSDERKIALDKYRQFILQQRAYIIKQDSAIKALREQVKPVPIVEPEPQSNLTSIAALVAALIALVVAYLKKKKQAAIAALFALCFVSCNEPLQGGDIKKGQKQDSAELHLNMNGAQGETSVITIMNQ